MVTRHSLYSVSSVKEDVFGQALDIVTMFDVWLYLGLQNASRSVGVILSPPK